MSIQFVKMHGCGNDYVFTELFTQQLDNLPEIARKISNRHTGVGGDGLITVGPVCQGIDADAHMRIFNLDGSEGEMCGNGLRCAVKMIHDHKLIANHNKNPMRVQTGAGVLTIDYSTDTFGWVNHVSVDMSKPILDAAKVPVEVEELTECDQPATYRINVPGTPHRLEATFISMGNPHAVIFVDALNEDNKDHYLQIGKALEYHNAFPNRMNVHFVEKLDDNTLRVLHWERGSGPTLACGTGACACAVASILLGHCQRDQPVTTQLPGGNLQITWLENDHIQMAGPATEAFRGEWQQL